jgi:hypothetical protein
MEPKLFTRDEFRESVFKRDGHRCVFCSKPFWLTASLPFDGKLDAHHIIERRLWGNGGYYLDNGVTVCEEHHMACERTIISIEDCRAQAGITKIVVPDQFYPEQPIDKWGNYILDDGRRTRGELFYDESVQKVLAQGGVLELFTPYVKYGRTFHLPHSPGIHDDDKALKDYSNFEGRRVVITRKVDGENTSGYSDGHIHARSIDSKGGEDRAWVKKFLSENVCFNLPEGWRVCGENLWARHSIPYTNLKSYFYGFSIWNERNICLDWEDTKEWFEILGITRVPILHDGAFDLGILRDIEREMDPEKDEGYVIRIADSFKYSEFKSSIAKYVRKDHVKTINHWRHQRIVPNELKQS